MVKIVLFTIVYVTLGLAKNITLLDSFESALKNNPDLKIYYHKINIAKEQKNQALSPLLPQINATASNNRYFDAKTSNVAYKENPSDFTTISTEIKLTQTLFDLSNFTEYSKSKLSATIATLEYDYFLQELILQVAGVYFDYLSLEEKVLVAQKKLATLQQQKKDIQKRYDLGDATIQDLSDTNSKYYLSQSELLELKMNLEVAKAKFKAVTSLQLDKNNSFAPLEDIKNNQLLESLDWYLDMGSKNNLEIQIAKLNLLLSKKDIKSKAYEFFPRIDLIGSSSYYRSDDSISTVGYHQSQNYVGIQLSASLFEGGRTSSRLKEAKEKENQVGFELKSLEKELYFNITKEYMGLQTASSQLESLKIGLDSAQTTLDAAKVGYQVGSRTQFEVLQAIEQYYSIKNRLSDTKYKFKMTSLKLKKLIGNLQKKDLSN